MTLTSRSDRVEEERLHQDPLCITGPHRSGTSMVVRLLHGCGLWLGPEEALLPPAPDNPEGFWEHERVVQLDDDVLNALGGAWDLPPAPAMGWASSDDLGRLRGDARRLASELGAAGWWGFKDPRACLTLPFWLEVAPTLRVVICLRNPLEVATSLHERNGFSYASGLRLWSAYLRAVAGTTSHERRLVTHFDAYFADPEDELARVLRLAGRPAESAVIGAAAMARHKGRRHSRFGWQDLAGAGVARQVRDLYMALCEEAGWWDDADHDLAGRVPRSAPAGAPAPVDAAPAADGGEGAPEPVGMVDERVVDYRLLRWRYHRRGGRIDRLEQQVADLQADLAAAGAALERMTGERDDAVRRARAAEVAMLQIAATSAGRTDAIEMAVLELVAAAGSDAGLDTRSRRALATTSASARVLVSTDSAVPSDLMGRRLIRLPVSHRRAAPSWWIAAHRANGAEFLVLTDSDDQKEDLAVRDHLARHYAVRRTADGVTVADLRIGLDAVAGIGPAVAEFEMRLGRSPSVLDWADRFAISDPTLAVTSAPAGLRTLDYADSSFDLVVVPADRPELRVEADRVAANAVVLMEEYGRDAARAATEWCGPSLDRPAVTVAVDLLDRAADPVAFLQVLLDGLPAGAMRPVLAAGPLPAELRSRIEERFGDVRVVDVPPASGALRLASWADHASGDLLVLVSATAVPAGRWLPAVMTTFAQHGADVVCGRHVRPDGTLLAAGGSPESGVDHSVGTGRDQDADHAVFRHVRRVDAPAGPALAAKVDALHRVGSAATTTMYQPEWVLVDLTGMPRFATPFGAPDFPDPSRLVARSMADLS